MIKTVTRTIAECPVVELFFDSSLSVAGVPKLFGGKSLFSPLNSNWRAGIFLVVLPVVLMVLVAPVLGYWYDPAGVADDFFGNSMTELADLNGDGFDEFLVGVAGSDTTGLDAGQVFLWLGGPTVNLVPDRIWNGTSPEHFGWSLANIGDVNNDGDADFAVGAPLSNAGGAARGRVCIFYGDSDPQAISDTPDVVISGANGGDQFGYAISAAGDFDGDGKDDFIVGAPYSNLRAQNAGAAYVIYGANGGPSTNLADATVFAGEIADDHFGWSVSDAGNFLGGNENCVAVGAPLANTHGGLDAGAVYVFQGRLSGATPDTTIDFVAGISANAKAGSQFGYAVRGVGHLDTDSNDDLAVGGPYCNEAGSESGRVEIFYGGLNPSVVADHTIDGQTATDNFGWSLDRLGDVSGSSRDDVLIGAPFHDLTASNGGRAYIYEGGSSATGAGSLDIIPNLPANGGNGADDHFGYAVALAGDFNGDGQPDYAVSAPAANTPGTNARAGVVTLTLSGSGPVPAMLRKWKARWQEPGLIELDFALAIPSDQFRDVRLTRQRHNESGLITTEELVWSGPARLAAENAVGVLLRSGTGFAFRDDLSGSTADWQSYSYGLELVTAEGESMRWTSLAGPGAPPPAVPVTLALTAAWPNPANPRVNIRFRAAANTAVTLRIMDVRGHVVRELHQGQGLGDWQTATWDGVDDAGQDVSSGVYLIRLESGGQLRTERVTLAR